jgi:hypothetical protein
MNKIRNLIVEMLTDIVPNPSSIADMCCRSDKKVLVVRTKLNSSFVFVYADKSTEAETFTPNYPDFGYAQDYAKMFDDCGLRLLAFGSGSPDRDDPTTLVQVMVWSATPFASIVLFAAMLKTWKKVKFYEPGVIGTISSLIGKYESHRADVVQASFPFKTYFIKPSMDSIDLSGEMSTITSQVEIDEDPRHRAVHTLVMAHIEAARNQLLKTTQKLAHHMNRTDIDFKNFVPEDLFKYMKLN